MVLQKLMCLKWCYHDCSRDHNNVVFRSYHKQNKTKQNKTNKQTQNKTKTKTKKQKTKTKTKTKTKKNKQKKKKKKKSKLISRFLWIIGWHTCIYVILVRLWARFASHFTFYKWNPNIYYTKWLFVSHIFLRSKYFLLSWFLKYNCATGVRALLGRNCTSN